MQDDMRVQKYWNRASSLCAKKIYVGEYCNDYNDEQMERLMDMTKLLHVQ